MGTTRDFRAAAAKIQAVKQEAYRWKLYRQEDQVGDYCNRQIQMKMEEEDGIDHISKKGKKAWGDLKPDMKAREKIPTWTGIDVEHNPGLYVKYFYQDNKMINMSVPGTL